MSLLLLCASCILLLFFLRACFALAGYCGAGVPSVRADAPLPTATVLIPAYNEARHIVQAMQSLLRDLPDGVDMLVVDDGSTDGTPDRVRAAFADDTRVRLVSGDHAGYGATLQRGLECATGDVLILADADSEYSPHYIRNGLRAFADPALTAARALLCVRPSSSLLAQMQDDDFISTSADMRACSRFGMLTVVSGAAGFWRVSALRAIGGFRAQWLSADLDATIRLLTAGGRLRLLPACRVATDVPDTIRACLRQRRRWIFGANQVFAASICQLQSARAYFVLCFSFVFRQCLHLVAPIVDITAVLALASLHAWGALYLAWYGAWIFLDVLLHCTERRWQGSRQRQSCVLCTPLRRIALRLLLCAAAWSAWWYWCTRRRPAW